MTKVLHLLPSLTRFGGTPSKTFNLIKMSKYDHIVFAWQCWEGQREFEENINYCSKLNINVVDATRNGFLRLIWDLIKTIREEEIGIVHAYFNGGTILAGIVKTLMPSLKVVTAFVGADSSAPTLTKVMTNILIRRFDHVIFISKYIKDWATKEFPSVNNVPGTIIYNGGNLPHTVDRSGAFRKDHYRFVCVGGLNEHKNYILLPHVAKRLAENTQIDFEFVIAGEGTSRESIEQLARQLGVWEHISLPGYISDIPTFLKSGDIFLHPATNEGFGIAVVEAMGAGLPTILAAAGGLPELAVDGESAIFVPPHDADAWCSSIAKLITNPKAANRLGLAGREHAKRTFSITEFASAHDALYSKVITLK